jgi:hypothetical protein
MNTLLDFKVSLLNVTVKWLALLYLGDLRLDSQLNLPYPSQVSLHSHPPIIILNTEGFGCQGLFL